MRVRRFELEVPAPEFRLESVTRYATASVIVIESRIGAVALVSDELLERMRRVGMRTELAAAGIGGVRLRTDGALDFDDGRPIPTGWHAYRVPVRPRILRKAAAELLAELERREAVPHRLRVTLFESMGAA